MKQVTRYACDYCNRELKTEKGMARHEAKNCYFSPGSHSCATCHFNVGFIQSVGQYDTIRTYDFKCEINQGINDDSWRVQLPRKYCPYYQEIDYQSPDSKKLGSKKNYWIRTIVESPEKVEK